MGRRVLFLILVFFWASGGARPVTLRMVGPEDVNGAWAEIIRRFEARHPQIRIQYLSGPWSTDDRQNMYIRSFLSGDPFEIVYMDVTWTAKFAARGWLLPLDRWLSPREARAFFPGALKAGYYRGHLYRLPVTTDVGVLYWRRDLLPYPPRTWKELEDLCRRYAHPPGLYCLVFQGMQYEGLTCNFLEFLWGAGGRVFDPRGRPALNSPAGLWTLNFLKHLVKDGLSPRAVLSFQEQHSLEFFLQGRALFMRNWPYAWRIINRKGSPLRGKVGLAPLPTRKGHLSAGTLGGWGLGIARGTKAPETALAFIKFATSAEAQKILHLRRGWLPARRDLFQDPDLLRQSPYLQDLAPLLERARPRPVHPAYPRISDTLQKHASAVLAGVESPREALTALSRTLKFIVEEPETGLAKRLFLDYELRKTLKNTLFFGLVSVFLEFALGLFLALLLYAPFPGRTWVRLSVLIPWALPTAVMALSWQWMLNNPFGVINDLLVRAGVLAHPVDWLASPRGAMWSAILADVWKTTPFVVLILLAGLYSVPRELKESLAVDGAGPVKRFFYLDLPLLLPFLRVALIFRLLQALGIFDLIWVLTRGGPADGTRTLCLYLYDLAFRYDDLGYALFLTALFFLALIGLSFLIVRLTTLEYERRR
ncbi:extracellular solute-binding protein [Thermosulfurimonas marina]|uniref:Extracellular solute-binding protein n=1 Tax=Thermosulfurimonas marina TaxID=2047767 RepID=A0A6H1WTQ4_9BACT|nr:extracellular solute-binding protein [Thermosulfurimonas marina]QJA06529.1 extracellular solute-binding protein [Thermosulfurimonas marina]